MSHKRNHNVGKDQFNLNGASPSGEKKWHVFYLRPRTESLVCKLLTNLNYEVFFPVIQSVRIWKNRQKRRVKLPLFPNYLFVYTHAHELYVIKRLPNVVTCVTFGGSPSTISEKEIEGIRRMLGMECGITVEPKFTKGERVRIVSGPMAGFDGILVKQHSKTRFGIQLRSIGHSIFVDVLLSDLEKF